MRVLIIGSGPSGAGVARALALRGHAVTVLDRDPVSFERLGAGFKGRTVQGNSLDREALLGAGIEHVDGLAALSNSDELNVVVARLARQFFGVPTVVARLYDPRKAEIYRRLGIQTISPVAWGVHRITELLCRSPLDSVLSLGGDVDLLEAEVPPQLAGRTVADLTAPGEIRVVALTRAGRTSLPAASAPLQQGDLLYLAVVGSASDRLKEMLGLA